MQSIILKGFKSTVTNGAAMAMLYLKSKWETFKCLKEKAFFSLKLYSYRIFFVQKSKLAPKKLTHVQNFSQIGQKMKGSRILNCNNNKNGLMT